jgi:SAM-dependent methyltransferase
MNYKNNRYELSINDAKKIQTFLLKIKEETYPEPPSQLHSKITNDMLEHFFSKYSLPSKTKVLDIGCGQGVALEIFERKGLAPIGITLNSEDVRVCRDKGYEVYEMDQSFLDFEDRSFDFVWCRHCIEHSIFPYFTLSEIYRVLTLNGYVYIEVPAPDTNCRHQENPNHYSTLGKSLWLSLIKRTGFNILEVLDINFTVPAGSDTYWAIIAQKTSEI